MGVAQKKPVMDETVLGGVHWPYPFFTHLLSYTAGSKSLNRYRLNCVHLTVHRCKQTKPVSRRSKRLPRLIFNSPRKIFH